MLKATKYGSITNNMNGQFSLAVRRRELRADSRGYNKWKDLYSTVTFRPERTVLVLCDVWDHHWSRGAEERLEQIVPQINATANAARNLGVLVVHAPSNTMDWYKDHPARIRIQETDPVELPEELVYLLDEGAKNCNIIQETMELNNISNIMSNSFGFGGTNATLIFSKL